MATTTPNTAGAFDMSQLEGLTGIQVILPTKEEQLKIELKEKERRAEKVKSVVPGVPKSGKHWKQGKHSAMRTGNQANVGIGTTWDVKMKHKEEKRKL